MARTTKTRMKNGGSPKSVKAQKGPPGNNSTPYKPSKASQAKSKRSSARHESYFTEVANNKRSNPRKSSGNRSSGEGTR